MKKFIILFFGAMFLLGAVSVEAATPGYEDGDIVEYPPGWGEQGTTTIQDLLPEQTVYPTEANKTTTVSNSKTKLPTVKVATTKVKKASKKRKASIAKISLKKITGAKGYRVYIYSFTKTKKLILKKNVKKCTFTIKSSKLKNKKKLFVKARAFKIIRGKKYYGKWSKLKKISIKN